MSKYRTLRPRTTRNAVINATLFVASSGLTRANRVQGTVRSGAELDAALTGQKKTLNPLAIRLCILHNCFMLWRKLPSKATQRVKRFLEAAPCNEAGGR